MSHFSQENLARFPKDRLSKITCDAQFVSTVIISIIAYISPILFLIIPVFKGEANTATKNNYNVAVKTDCQTNILSIILKLITLSMASYWIFWQKSRIIYPRTHWPRLLSLGMMLLTSGIYWLFYTVTILDRPNAGQESAVLFSSNCVDTLLYIHVVAIVVMEIRLKSPNSDSLFLCEVVRSTDGEQKFYNLSKMTIQEASFILLQYYYRDFSLNNPASLIIGSLSKRRQMKGLNDSTTANNTQANMNLSNKDFKIYNVDNPANQNNLEASAIEQSKQVLAAVTARKKESNQNANERYYEQLEWERHCRKRKCRLEVTAEDAFNQVNRYEGYTRKTWKQFGNQGNVMDAQEAATVLFPSIARPLQKYLRTTRQHLHYSLANTTNHLAESFKRGVSYRSFLTRYFYPRPQLAYPYQPGISDNSSESYNLDDSVEWNLSSENPLTENIKENVFFMLTSNDFSLCITIYKHPKIQITETFPDNRCRFTLKINTTSV